MQVLYFARGYHFDKLNIESSLKELVTWFAHEEVFYVLPHSEKSKRRKNELFINERTTCFPAGILVQKIPSKGRYFIFSTRGWVFCKLPCFSRTWDNVGKENCSFKIASSMNNVEYEINMEELNRYRIISNVFVFLYSSHCIFFLISKQQISLQKEGKKRGIFIWKTFRSRKENCFLKNRNFFLPRRIIYSNRVYLKKFSWMFFFT